MLALKTKSRDEQPQCHGILEIYRIFFRTENDAVYRVIRSRTSCVVNLLNLLNYCHVLIEMGDGRHQIIDRRNMEFGRIIADKLKKQPDLLDLAKGNLERWIAQSHGAPPPAHLEWKGILESLSSAEITELLTQDSENARRLRQSNPFVGTLTPQER